MRASVSPLGTMVGTIAMAAAMVSAKPPGNRAVVIEGSRPRPGTRGGKLNRSPKWGRAESYLDARTVSGSKEPVR